ncbi:MAG: GGDEF domain-containing protein [Phycisphaerales bacterium]|nr:GGDEF domain-containing protein [Phycisphaerales bacterium]
MNPEMLERVMSCRDLPTLPAVAMRVLELTSTENVSMKALAETIQNDQALAAKVLRTVNSSMYALRTKCSSINQAIVMLGPSAVTTLALGFTHVSAIKHSRTEGFDLEDHWKRSLYTGVAARIIASKARLGNPEECFLGGLLQDVGMIAMYQALGKAYLRVIMNAEGDHRKVSKFELEQLELHHADVGAMLAMRWKLPESLVMPIKYHERPTAAPMEHIGVVRAVGLGNIASDVLTSPEPVEVLRKFYQRAEQWFALTTLQADDVLKSITSATRELSSLLSVPTGELASTEKVLALAREKLAAIEIPTQEHGTQANPGKDLQTVDELTGVASRFQFDRAMVAAFEQTRSGVGPLSVAMFDVDAVGEINESCGSDAGDIVLINVAGRLEQIIQPLGGMVARFDGGRFIVLLPRLDRASAVRAAEQARAAVAASPIKLIAAKSGAPSEVSVTVSVGVAAVDTQMIKRFDEPSSLLAIIDQAVKAAQKAGRNTIRVYAPALAA